MQWPDCDVRAALDGFCYVDIDRQEVYGEVKGLAKQAHIRPLIEAVDVPVALPYIDAFTDVPVPCPSWCAWKVDLVHNDFDLWLDLKPTLGKYMSVPMKWANGEIHVRNFTRDNQFCYVTTVGPISAEDVEGRPLEGTVVISSTNGMNTVAVKAKSAQPLANVLKIGGFEGDYVGADVIGNSQCDLTFRFLSLGTLLLCAAALFALQLLPERRAALAAAGLVCAALLTASITETNIMSAQGESSYASARPPSTLRLSNRGTNVSAAPTGARRATTPWPSPSMPGSRAW